ncbi:MAG TPA: carboxypeptidase-like regulatory domain-containing protein, partial [Bacteroidales bacterium]
MKNTTLDAVLKEIKRQSGKNIIYNNNLLDKYNNETFELKNVTLEDALQTILEGKNLQYKIVDDVIIIEPKPGPQNIDKPASLIQTIKGNVFDIESNSPLIGASVIIQGFNPPRGTVTDPEGNYKLEKVPVGRYNIQVSYVGYQSKMVSEVLVTSAKEVVMNIGLKQALTQMKEISVTHSKDKPLNTMAIVSSRSFTVEETRRYAGGLDDPARMASAFAGVAVGNIQNNNIIIRGNASRGLSWRLEGIDIPNPSHLAGQVEGGGIVTIFSSQLLANSDFFTGAFPAEYGNALSGVFDMKLRNGDNEKYEQTFQAGTIGIDFASEGPIGKKGGASYLINYRYSTIGLIKDLGLLTTNETPGYQDLSFKLNFPTKKAGVFSLWGIGGIDKDFGTDETDSAKWQTSFNRLQFSIKEKMGATGLAHKYMIGNQTYIRTTIAASGTQDEQNFTRLDDNLVRRPYLYFIDNSARFTFSSMLNHKFNSKNTLRMGVDFHVLFYNVKINGTI